MALSVASTGVCLYLATIVSPLGIAQRMKLLVFMSDGSTLLTSVTTLRLLL